MNSPQFPIYGSFQAARSHNCHQCLKPFTTDAPRDSGFPHGRGQWQLTCQSCGMSTWFDLYKSEAAE